MKTQNGSSELPRRVKALRLLLGLLIVLASYATAFAQESGVITLMPREVRSDPANCALKIGVSPDCKIVLTFQTSSLPTGAQFNSADLLLVGATQASQTITVFLNGDPNNKFAEYTTPTRTRFTATNRADWSLNRPSLFLDGVVGGKPQAFTLTMQTKSRGQASTWHGSDTSEPTNLRPRLVFTYAIKDRPAVVQTQGLPGMQSAGKFLPDPVAAAQFGSVAISSIGSHVPVSYKNLVYLIVKNGAQSQLQALPAGGGPPVWTSQNLDGAGQHLVLSRLGRLYIVGNKAIFAFQLDPNSGIPTPGAIVRDQNGLDPGNPPAVGAEGSLYFVYSQTAYALNPDLQELWSLPLSSSSTSRITVGPSGRFVYLTVNGQGLLAIKAQTGETAPIADGKSQQALAKTSNISFHAPAVIQHPDGTEEVYVVANAAISGTLAAFANPNGATVDQLTELWPALTGIWSQPLLDLSSPGTTDSPSTTKKVYAVLVANDIGTMTAVDWLKGTVASLTPTFAAADLPNPTVKGTNLGIDQSGTIVVWNAKGGNLATFSSAAGAVLPVASPSGLVEGTRLVFGTDGTWYAIDPSGGGTLRIVVPQYALNSDSAATLTSPEHIRVTGAAMKDTTISAPGYIFLGNGFRVPLGKTLTVKQPKQ